MDTILELGLLNGALVAALALVVAAVTWVCRRPALAHALWLLVLIKVVTPPLIPVEIPRPEPLFAVSESAPEVGTPSYSGVASPVAETAAPSDPQCLGDEEVAAPAAGMLVADAPVNPMGEGQLPDTAGNNRGLTPLARPVAAHGISWQTGLLTVWLTGSCVWWGLAAWRLNRFRRLLRAGGLACSTVQARADMLARRLGLGHCPPIRLLPAPLPPLLWSMPGQAFIFLPERLWAELSFEQQDTLLAHELAHYQRRDHWVRWLELLALGLYWWHPAAWLARWALHEAEELLCDARVLRTLPAAADAYAQALIQTVAFLSGPRLALPGAASGVGHVRPLKARITMMMRGTNADRLPRAGAWALAALGLTLLMLRPVWGDSPAVEITEVQAPTLVAQDTPPSPPVPDQPARPGARALVQVQAGQPGAAGPGGGMMPGERAAVDAMKEQVELFRTQLAAKEAELQEARALLKLAKQHLKRVTQLHNTSGVGEEVYDKAEADAEIQQARVRGKEAQVREAQLRLAQVSRRATARREGLGAGVGFGGGGVAGMGGFGGGGGAGMGGFGGGGMVKPAAPGMPAAPGGRITSGAAPAGAGTPAPANALPRMPDQPGAGPSPRARGDALQERLDQMESRLETLLREVKELRSEMSGSRRQGQGGRPPASSSLRRQSNNPFGGPGDAPPAADVPGRP